ncbi:MAG: 3-phosphoshikimate 1-carboxyvinyltransferase [Proteobacteria bacterium]|nr:3-phosphoshikimate 1-carboxyvinyltransferase [Pseudomonadota bacterium]
MKAGPGGPLRGRVTAPGDKSISHRALLLGGMAEGRTTVEGLLEGADVMATAAAMRAFGAQVARGADGLWTVDGRGELRQPDGVIDCGNSGTALRLLMGAAAGYLIQTEFDGDASLRGRPVDRVIAPLSAMGATVRGDGLPVTVIGAFLRGLAYEPPVASAQVKSAVLLAGLHAASPTTVLERRPTRDHTERMLPAFGADLSVEQTEIGRAVHLRPGARLRGTSVRVPGDPSSAAFPLAAALITPGSEVTVAGVLLNPLRCGLFQTLREMGAELEIAVREDAGEPVGDVTARFSRLRGVVVPPERAPSMIDEYPILSVLAAFAEGTTVMRGVEDLRRKETDRITAVATGLRACGVEVDEEMDGLIVHGRGRPPRGGAAVETHGDHRLAMGFAVLGLGAEAAVTVDRAEMVATSFPGFVAMMGGLGADVAPA